MAKPYQSPLDPNVSNPMAYSAGTAESGKNTKKRALCLEATLFQVVMWSWALALYPLHKLEQLTVRKDSEVEDQYLKIV